MTYNVLLERLLKDVGGCGKFQWVLAVVVSLNGVMECWSMLHMSFMGQEPNYFCIRKNGSDRVSINHSNESIRNKSCTTTSISDCSRHHFEDDIHTVVSEVRRHSVAF